MLSRRSILTLGATGLAAGVLPAMTFGSSDPKQWKWKGKRPKNIIFCVADGMSTQTVTLCDYFQQLAYGHRSYWSELLDNPLVSSGWQDTRSLSSIVTDSAAAASAWGSGHHHWNGMLNVYPDNTKLMTLSKLMQDKGVKVGLVTTTTMTHATPSGFSINHFSRDDEAGIAKEHLDSGVDILLGGGDKFFSATKRKDKLDLYGEFAKKGFKVAKTRDELKGLKGEKILGIFSDSHLPFTVDRDNDATLQKEVPTLAEMATVAIDNLKGSKNGFLLQIEGGKVDHAGHANDLGGHIYDQIAFEEAVKVAIEFAMQDKETLVIITADHATGGPSLNGAGDEYSDSTAALASIAGIKTSYAPLLQKVGKNPAASQVQDAIKATMGYSLKTEEAQGIVDAMNGKSPFALCDLQKGSSSALALILQNHTKVGWTSLNHTNDHVMVSAFGPGSEQVQGLTHNVEFFDLMCSAKGIEYKNPSMTYADAKKAMDKHKEAQSQMEESEDDHQATVNNHWE